MFGLYSGSNTVKYCHEAAKYESLAAAICLEGNKISLTAPHHTPLIARYSDMDNIGGFQSKKEKLTMVTEIT